MNDGLERFARDFEAGTVLFEEGQPGEHMYVVTSGQVEIRRKVGEIDRVLAVLMPGDFFGEMAILNNRPRSATAVTRVESRLLVIEGRMFEAMLRARPEIGSCVSYPDGHVAPPRSMISDLSPMTRISSPGLPSRSPTARSRDMPATVRPCHASPLRW